MFQSNEIMVDDMTYIDMGYIDENDVGMEMLSYDETVMSEKSNNNTLILSLVIGICVVLGIVLGIIFGKRAAKK